MNGALDHTHEIQFQRCSECGRSAVACFLRLHRTNTPLTWILTVVLLCALCIASASLLTTTASTSSATFRGAQTLTSTTRITDIGWPWKFMEWQTTTYVDSQGTPARPTNPRTARYWLGPGYLVITRLGEIPGRRVAHAASLPDYAQTREIHLRFFPLAAAVLLALTPCVALIRALGIALRRRARSRARHKRCPCCGYPATDELIDQIWMLRGWERCDEGGLNPPRRGP